MILNSSLVMSQHSAKSSMSSMTNASSPPNSSVDKDLLRLMRDGPNRRCCDCGVELKDMQNIYASTRIGCFVCVNCKQLHEILSPPHQCKSVYLDQWTEAELSRVRAMGNTRTNTIYERYIPATWTKLTPDVDQKTRKKWIEAKYEKLHFMIPHYKEDAEFRESRLSNASATLPMRLVDYFVVVGLGQLQIDERSLLNPSSKPEEVFFRGEVLDCFPEADSHPGCPLPDHIGQFAFPEGLCLSFFEPAPTMLTFVLTNTSGIKLYGIALRIYEEVDELQLKQALQEGLESPIRGKSPKIRLSSLPTWLTDLPKNKTPLYCPKALILLSHYPFYTAYSEFLQQLYRISLSEAPVPIERYICNFVCEVPLPPQGQVQVVFSLPDRTLQLKRPPINRLPLVDFSYRPLFASLSLDNVITVFSWLLTEAKVVLCSSHIALLNPVAEALVSLLFPFVWQGAYIPVMPSVMTDMLDAPVPFLVGISSDYLKRVPSEYRPLGIIFVDLDNDIVDLGLDEDSCRPGHPVYRSPIHMPDRETAKLKTKLLSYAAGVHRSNLKNPKSVSVSTGTPGGTLGSTGYSPGACIGGSSAGSFRVAAESVIIGLEKSDLAFPTNEHLLPINSFATEQGQQIVLQNSSVQEGVSKNRLPNLRTKKSPRGDQNILPSPHEILNCKFLAVTDARNNCVQSDPLGFNADEIRGAFLRFFVSILRTYKEYLIVPDPKISKVKDLFNREAFMKDVPAQCYDFMYSFLRSQMFERFLEEQLSNKNQPEIRFFEESIVQKLNRSKKNSKRDTPFLNDTSGDHSQVFTPPPPNNAGLPDDGRMYTYPTFPKLIPARFGKMRWAQRLCKVPEQMRIVSSVNHREMITAGRRLPLMRTPKRKITRKKPSSKFLMGLDTDTRGVIEGITKAQQLWHLYKAHQRTMRLKNAGHILLRSLRRHVETKCHRASFKSKLEKVRAIQRAWMRSRRRAREALFLQWVIYIQTCWRMRIDRREFEMRKKAVIRLQAVTRRRQCYVAYRVVLQLIIQCQAIARGWIKRRVARLERAARMVGLRAHIFELWRRACTPLLHRSKFWVFFQGEGLLDLAVHEDEALRLWKELGLIQREKEFLTRMKFFQTYRAAVDWLSNVQQMPIFPIDSTSSPKLPSVPLSPISPPIQRKVLWRRALFSVNRSPASTPSSPKKRNLSPPAPPLTVRENSKKGLSVSSPTRKGGKSGGGGYFGLGLTRQAITALKVKRNSTVAAQAVAFQFVQINYKRLEEEREALYAELKREKGDVESLEKFRLKLFKQFGLETNKKRKQTLVAALWENLALAGASADAVLKLSVAINKEEADAQSVWVQARRDARIRADLLCTVQACIVSIQALKCNESLIKKPYYHGAAAMRVLSNGGGVLTQNSITPKSVVSSRVDNSVEIINGYAFPVGLDKGMPTEG